MTFTDYQRSCLREIYRWYGVTRWAQYAYYFWVQNRQIRRNAR
jgi:hypothetical protein